MGINEKVIENMDYFCRVKLIRLLKTFHRKITMISSITETVMSFQISG